MAYEKIFLFMAHNFEKNKIQWSSIFIFVEPMFMSSLSIQQSYIKKDLKWNETRIITAWENLACYHLLPSRKIIWKWKRIIKKQLKDSETIYSVWLKSFGVKLTTSYVKWILFKHLKSLKNEKEGVSKRFFNVTV